MLKSAILSLALVSVHSQSVVDPNCNNKGLCIPNNGHCIVNTTTGDDDCCEGMACFGYNFFKHCQKPPACLKKFHDCSQGIECCDKMICVTTPAGAKECQVRTVTNEPPAPTPAPVKAPNTKTTHVPGKRVRYNRACAVGDPHL